MAANDSGVQFLRTLIPTLPTEFSQKLRTVCGSNPTNESFLENLVRLVSGAPCTSDASPSLQAEWSAKQAATRQALDDLVKPHRPLENGDASRNKRQRDDVEEEGIKRQRTVPPDAPTAAAPATTTPPTDDPIQFVLHSISTTSPLRKKLDVELRSSSITFSNPTSKAIEATIPLSCLRRSIVVPTRGKTKPHWTIILLSSDVVTLGPKPIKGAVDENPQIIFGVDAVSTAAWSTSSRTPNGELQQSTQAKGADTLLSIQEFISRLPPSIIRSEPSTDEFRSSVNPSGGAAAKANASNPGVPGLEAYRAAKPGTLWFTKEGLLWGESKPCEFWALEDLLSSTEGVRLSMGSGRVFSITLVRKTPGFTPEDDEEEDMGLETELSMVDSREREAVHKWVQKHQNAFGRKPGVEMTAQEKAEADAKVKAAKVAAQQIAAAAGPVTIRSMALDSDSEDEDFVGSESESGSGGSGSEDEDDSGEDVEGEEDAEGDEDDEDDAEYSAAEDEGDGEEEELDPARHPLMRPGAVPKMTKAVMNMVVDMVEDDLMGEEVDELDD